jgi:hypothetical protein
MHSSLSKQIISTRFRRFVPIQLEVRDYMHLNLFIMRRNLTSQYALSMARSETSNESSDPSRRARPHGSSGRSLTREPEISTWAHDCGYGWVSCWIRYPSAFSLDGLPLPSRMRRRVQGEAESEADDPAEPPLFLLPLLRSHGDQAFSQAVELALQTGQC